MARVPERNVVLTGFMGSGKTTVGRLVARELGWTFVDTDDVIVARHRPIDAIFAEQGEEAFRAFEREVAAEVARSQHHVIATGGRMLLDPANADALTATGRVFCLAASADEIVRRLTADVDGPVRPLLAGDDPAAAVARLLNERAEGYGQFEQVHTANDSPEAVAARIIRLHRSPARLDDGPRPPADFGACGT
ncbi:MAG: shikimate kinase [Acidimicrobiales bacterium]|nr:shikimate kinase [Acidimicrobiaceae bacterium]MXX41826.1 shikimate kinase [Acidimicrobiales bacterium]MYD33814.1 shikimate kinase [Acidimicrobiales bacterium]MYI08926.1 shikimate kinase [Acidimicrobiales bacterium]